MCIILQYCIAFGDVHKWFSHTAIASNCTCRETHPYVGDTKKRIHIITYMSCLLLSMAYLLKLHRTLVDVAPSTIFQCKKKSQIYLGSPNASTKL